MPYESYSSSPSPTASVDTGVLYCNDNLERLAAMPADSVDLIYLDPPFFSNRHYEMIWGDEAEVRSFEDRWEGGIQHYIGWMKPRVEEMRRVLKPTGSLYLHCDPHASHHLKIMLDDIFGPRRFLNEIVWHYQTSGGAPKKTLIRNHDTIFRYSKGPAKGVTWIAPREPWPKSTLDKWQRDETGRIYHIHNDTGVRYYIDPAGKLMDDVWDITLAARSRERLGWPTQKPEALLQRIIEASSNEDDIVLDPFCGPFPCIEVSPGRVCLGIRSLESAQTIPPRHASVDKGLSVWIERRDGSDRWMAYEQLDGNGQRGGLIGRKHSHLGPGRGVGAHGVRVDFFELGHRTRRKVHNRNRRRIAGGVGTYLTSRAIQERHSRVAEQSARNGRLIRQGEDNIILSMCRMVHTLG